ncbi:MAG: hypothetical protein ACTHWA_07240 [Arachnia sp.]
MLSGARTALLGVAGALGIAVTGLAADASAVQALGWAACAGVGLSAMLRGPGLRVLGAVGVVLAVGAGVSAGFAGGWAWISLLFSAMLALAAVFTFRHGPAWRAVARSRRQEPARDLWKQFDAGEDPTIGEHVP